MNGRLYEPMLRGFLMPDNFVQAPENTQSYNRYAYCMNNPLSYSDPSGEYGIAELATAVVIAVVVAALTYTATTMFSGASFSWSGFTQSVVIGAVSGAVTFGIGSACSSMVSTSCFAVRAGVQALAHGLFQGTLTAATGGSFWTGFAAGALSSIAASGWSYDGNGSSAGLGWANSVRGNDLGTIAFGTVTGGAGAELTGGNFWVGAATGLVVSGCNHYLHESDGPGKRKNQQNKSGQKTKYSKLTLEQANERWANGGGDVTVDANQIDLDFVDPSTMMKGQRYLIQTLTNSRDGRVYGRLWITYQGNNQVSIDPDTYDFNQDGAFLDHPIRNTDNAIGRLVAGEGTPFKIYFSGLNTIHYSPPPTSSWSQTSHAFKF